MWQKAFGAALVALAAATKPPKVAARSPLCARCRLPILDARCDHTQPPFGRAS